MHTSDYSKSYYISNEGIAYITMTTNKVFTYAPRVLHTTQWLINKINCLATRVLPKTIGQKKPHPLSQCEKVSMAMN
jgi:hypothetical protein